MLLVTVLAMGVAGAASAAPLNWSGTLTTNLGDFPPAHITGGGVATINNSTGLGPHISTIRIQASRGGITGSATRFATDPDTVGNAIAAILFEGINMGTGTFGPISGGAASTTVLTQNTMPVHGVVKICLLSTDCSATLDLVLNQGTQTGAGIGGLLTIGGDSPIRISIQAAPWTIKTVTAIDQITTTGKVNQTFIPVQLFGFAHSPSSGTTSTAQPSGVVQLVTPNQVQTNLPFGSNALVASGLKLRIHFIPEPGLMLLIGSGIAGVALLGRRRMRK